MHEDFDRCYRAVQSKDSRFDGWFVTAVLTTKIYCRPSCPVRPPYARNMRFYPTAAAAQNAGVLIETTELPFSDVAFAAGFSSIRQFNDTVRAVCDLTPTALRQRAR